MGEGRKSGRKGCKRKKNNEVERGRLIDGERPEEMSEEGREG